MLDNEIDDVAKSMTALPPDPAFAVRVSMRLADRRERQTMWTISSGPWVLAPIAAACVLVVAVFVARQGSVRLKPDAAPVATPAVVERPFQGRQGGAESPAPQIARLPELPPATIAPIQVDRLNVQPIVEMSAIDIHPIAIERIDISAMP